MKIFFALIALIPTLALAGVQKAGTYDSYIIDGSQPVHVKFVTDFETTDGCNHFGLMGKVRAAERDRHSTEQLLVADFGTIQTEMGCPPAPQPRQIHLESDAFAIQPISGSVYARVLVPQGFVLKVLP